MKTKHKIAISAGDINGIGPEIIGKALIDPRIRGSAEYIIFGPADIIPKLMFPCDAKVVDIGLPGVEYSPGKWSITSGEASYRAVKMAVEDVLKGHYNAVVTAPICKEAVNAAGHDFPGHTEMLKEWCGADDVIMMFLSDSFIVGLLTVHIPLGEVPRQITQQNTLSKIRLLDNELRTRFKIANPRIALCALNPHAGESGMFGREEIEVMIPAADAARKTGIEVTDPLPADTLFLRASKYSAILAVYHDQGLIPAKLAPGGSVNYTGGLPLIRTSPDHGAAFDIAGKGVAEAEGMINAIKWALKLCL